MALVVTTRKYRVDPNYTTNPTNTTDTMANYNPGGGGGTGGSVTGVVKTSGDQYYIWGQKGWRKDAIFYSDVSINGDLFVGGTLNGGNLLLENLNVSNDVSIGGNLWVDGEINGGLFGEDVEIGGNLTVQGDASIFGTLYATDVCTNTFTTYDTSTVNWYVQQDVCIYNNSYTYGDVYNYSNTYIEVDLSIGNNLYVTNDVSIGSNLFITNNITINNDVSISGDLYFDGSINGGDLELNNLNVSNDVSIFNDLYVDGSINEGNLELNNLNVSNDVSISGNIYLNGTPLGFNLSDLSDVSISNSPSNQNSLLFDADTSVWYDEETIDMTRDINIEDLYVTDYTYLGTFEAVGCWRFSVDISNNLRFEQYDGATWNYKYAIT